MLIPSLIPVQKPRFSQLSRAVQDFEQFLQIKGCLSFAQSCVIGRIQSKIVVRKFNFRVIRPAGEVWSKTLGNRNFFLPSIHITGRSWRITSSIKKEKRVT